MLPFIHIRNSHHIAAVVYAVRPFVAHDAQWKRKPMSASVAGYGDVVDMYAMNAAGTARQSGYQDHMGSVGWGGF